MHAGRKLYETKAITGGTAAVAFSRDDSLIVTADADTAVRVYDARTGKLTAENRDFLLEPLAVDFTSDGKQVIAAGADKVLAFIDARVGSLSAVWRRPSSLWLVSKCLPTARSSRPCS